MDTKTRKIELVKVLIRHEIATHGALVRNACENEMSCFEAYLVQRKNQLLAMPIETLDGLVRGLDLINSNRKAA